MFGIKFGRKVKSPVEQMHCDHKWHYEFNSGGGLCESNDYRECKRCGLVEDIYSESNFIKYKTKVFLICPVRNATGYQKQEMASYIENLESKGIDVYYPARDTNQVDDTGYRICKDNLNAIREANEVHIFWDKDSSGSLFDLGMAFALNKPIFIANGCDVKLTDGKSFANMISEWAKKSDLK